MITETKPQPAAPQPASLPGQMSGEELQQQMLQRRLLADQNMSMGLLAGSAAAIGGAIVWAVVTFVTEYQIGWMGIGVGFLVGTAIRLAGKGVEQKFAFLGAGLAFFGCLLGNLLASCIAISTFEEVSFWEVLGWIDPGFIVSVLVFTFHPMDLLFYALAIWAGYKYALVKS